MCWSLYVSSPAAVRLHFGSALVHAGSAFARAVLLWSCFGQDRALSVKHPSMR